MRGRRDGRRFLRTCAALVALLAVALAPVAGAAPMQDPTVAPGTTLSADGRTVSGAGKSLSVSQARNLAAGGQSVTVSAAGYDVNKGVYVSLCVIPPTNHPPSPCGGGQDRAGSSGASAWVSSNPPDYAAGLTQPYQAGGQFTVTITVASAIAPGLDCLSVRCAVVTRNDHTRGSDRSQDLFIPVTFAAAPPAGPTTTSTAPPPVVTTTTTAAPDPSTIPPVTTLSTDGRSTTDGSRTLAVSEVDDLDPAGAELMVTGEGYDVGAGVYVALCRVPEAGAAPGPCSSGEAAAWVSSSPPEHSADRAVPYDEGGWFEVELTVKPVIDGDTDCREVACAIATRSDDTDAADRTRDLLVPVAFGDEQPATTTTDAPEAALAADDGEGSGGSSALPVVVGAAMVAGAGGGAAAWRMRRRQVGTT